MGRDGASNGKPLDSLQTQITEGTSMRLKSVVRSTLNPVYFFFFPTHPRLYFPVHALATLTRPRPLPSDPSTPSTYSIKLGHSTNVYDNIVLHWQKTHRSKKITLRGCWPGGLLLDAETTDVITLREDITRASKIMFSRRLASECFSYET